jgi:CRISPR-associated protein Csm5
MKYRVTVLTPTLVGDGQALSPIDYMVWKDHVNVLDQGKIFAMMAKRPVFEGYLAQLRKAEKFDFQNWGGLAQSAALRRIPFESGAYSQIWERARAEHLFIPTFLKGAHGHYLPGSALRGALRTALVHQTWTARGEKLLDAWKEQFQFERGYRYAAQAQESASLGTRSRNPLRGFAVGDSAAVPAESLRVYLSRVATLAKQGSQLSLAWKTAPRGNVEPRRVSESTPTFTEMAVPGTLFEGAWQEKHTDSRTLAEAANGWARAQLALQKDYARLTSLPVLNQILGELEKRLEMIQGAGRGCLLQVGWGGGFTAKAALGDAGVLKYREILARMPFYAQALATGLPFPKTRRVVFLENTPAALPGWIHLEWL